MDIVCGQINALLGPTFPAGRSEGESDFSLFIQPSIYPPQVLHMFRADHHACNSKLKEHIGLFSVTDY